MDEKSLDDLLPIRTIYTGDTPLAFVPGLAFDPSDFDLTVVDEGTNDARLLVTSSGVVVKDTSVFGANKRVLSFVFEPQTDDAPHGQTLDVAVYDVPAATFIDCVGTAQAINESDESIDLIDFRAQFQRVGSGALAAKGSPDNIAKIGGVDQAITFEISSNSVVLHLVAAAGDTRKWTITVQIQVRPK